MPVLFGIEEIVNGTASAVLAPAVTTDRCKLPGEDRWYGLDEVPVGSVVVEVNHFGRHTSKQGEPLTLMDIANMAISVEVLVTEIILVRADALTPEQRAELGSGRTERLVGYNMIDEMGSRRGWLIRVLPIQNDQPKL